MSSSNGTKYSHFFYPEIKHFIQPQKRKKIETELAQLDPNFFDNFDGKRLDGENSSNISDDFERKRLDGENGSYIYS